MNIDDFLRIVRERWLLVVAATLVGALLGGLFFLLSPPRYTATTTLYVYSQTGNTPDAAYEGSLVSQQRVSSYTELVTSDDVTDDVVARLGLPESSASLAGQISASSASESVLIDLAVTDRDPGRAALICNTVAESFIGVVNDLERPSTPGAAQQVLVRPVRPAKVPTDTTNPTLPVTLLIGALLGLCLGVVVALVLSVLDKSVRTVAELGRVTGSPILGTVAHEPKGLGGSVVSTMTSGSRFAEAFRTLRTNLEFVDVDKPTKVLVFTSSVEGEGKTTTAASLAVALASAGKRVVLVDADLRRPRIAELLGLDGAVGVTSVLAGRSRLDDALQRWGPGLTRVLASGPLPPNPSELLSSQQAHDLFRALRERADYVLVDTPPVLPVTDAAAVSRWADGVVLLCRVGTTSSAQVQAATEALRSVSAQVVGAVATMVPTSAASGYLPASSYYRADGEPSAPPPSRATPMPGPPPPGSSPSPTPSLVPTPSPVSTGNGSTAVPRLGPTLQGARRPPAPSPASIVASAGTRVSLRSTMPAPRTGGDPAETGTAEPVADEVQDSVHDEVQDGVHDEVHDEVQDGVHDGVNDEVRDEDGSEASGAEAPEEPGPSLDAETVAVPVTSGRPSPRPRSTETQEA